MGMVWVWGAVGVGEVGVAFIGNYSNYIPEGLEYNF